MQSRYLTSNDMKPNTRAVNADSDVNHCHAVAAIHLPSGLWRSGSEQGCRRRHNPTYTAHMVIPKYQISFFLVQMDGIPPWGRGCDGCVRDCRK